jgi:putative membrane protein (TIGR04086 family)
MVVSYFQTKGGVNMFKKISIEIRGILRILILSAVLCLLSAAIIYFTGLSESLMAPLSKIILVVSVFYGSCYISKSYGTRGLVRGITTGLIFFILLTIATLAFSASNMNIRDSLVTLISLIIAGSLGGILGIGLSDTSA